MTYIITGWCQIIFASSEHPIPSNGYSSFVHWSKRYIKVIKGLCMVWQYRSLLHLTETPSHTDQATRTLLRDSTNHTIIVSICSLHLHITHSMKYLNHISLFIIPVPICNKNTTYPLISCTDEQHQHNSCEI